MLPSRPTVVGAPSIELSTASSAASTTASNRSSSAAPGDRGVPSAACRRGRRGRSCEAARKISPLPWWAVEPVRARPSPIRRASRAQPAPSTGASVTTTPMHEPAGRGGPSSAPGSSRPTGTPSTVSRSRSPKLVSSSTATVWPAGRDPRRRADAALEAEAGHPGAGADRALGGRRRRPARGQRRRVRGAHVVGRRPACARQSLRNESSHSPTTGITTSSATPACCSRAIWQRGVVHPAELHRRGQVDRRLDDAPLAGGEEAGALAGAVEHRAARGERPGVGVLGEHQRGDAGARGAASLGRRRLVADHRGVAEPDARRRRGPSWSGRSAARRS